jgi:hypothetical protein
MKTWPLLACVLALATQSSVAETLLARGSPWCEEEKDIVEVADAQGPSDLTVLLVRKIERGECGTSAGYWRIAQPDKLKTAKGNPYSRIHVVNEWGRVDRKPTYSLPAFVTTLEEEVRTRRGDYRLKIDNDMARVADCAEGGTVLLGKRDGSWVRTASAVFPIELDRETQVDVSDLQSVIREGCKGVDYLPPPGR